VYILKDSKRGFKTYDGWVPIERGVALELGEVQRFTKREAALNELKEGQTWVWFGCYEQARSVD